MELLTDIKLTSVATIRTALERLHTSYQIEGVVISSLPVTEELHAELPSSIQQSVLGPPHETFTKSTDYIICICSYLPKTHSQTGSKGYPSLHAMRVEKVAGYYSGVGDLFSALVLGHYYENSKSSNLEMSNTTSDAQNPLSQATIMALQKTYHVLLSTRSYVQSLPLTETEPNETDEEKDAKDPKRVVTRMKDRELRLIQEQEFLRSKDVNKEYASYMIPWEGFWE